MSSSKSSMIERLFASFEELELAINEAKKTLEARKGTPTEIIDRLKSYDLILTKQRVLAHRLCDHIASNQWEEVSRHVNLINGLSNFIKDDARSILGSPSESEDSDESTTVPEKQYVVC